MRTFLQAYTDAPPPEWLNRERIEDVTRTVMQQFYARLERELQLGLKHGYDVAVSDFDWDPATTSVIARILPITAGSAPPPGRRWTVYATSKGLPPCS